MLSCLQGAPSANLCQRDMGGASHGGRNFTWWAELHVVLSKLDFSLPVPLKGNFKRKEAKAGMVVRSARAARGSNSSKT